MTMAERLAIHKEIEEANRKRERGMVDRENLNRPRSATVVSSSKVASSRPSKWR